MAVLGAREKLVEYELEVGEYREMVRGLKAALEKQKSEVKKIKEEAKK